jgi:hypothetical protein
MRPQEMHKSAPSRTEKRINLHFCAENGRSGKRSLRRDWFQRNGTSLLTPLCVLESSKLSCQTTLVFKACSHFKIEHQQILHVSTTL